LSHATITPQDSSGFTEESFMERNYKSLQELTILDGFMFGAVMTDKSICQELLERILGFSIGGYNEIQNPV